MRLVRKEKAAVVAEAGEAVIAADTAVAVVDAVVAADVAATVVAEAGEAAIAAVTADATARFFSVCFLPNFAGAENSRAPNERRAICVR
jgi:hypothetical protein